MSFNHYVEKVPFAGVAGGLPSLHGVDVHDIICMDGKCSAIIDNAPLYRDTSAHITAYTSTKLAEKYLAKHGNPFE